MPSGTLAICNCIKGWLNQDAPIRLLHNAFWQFSYLYPSHQGIFVATLFASSVYNLVLGFEIDPKLETNIISITTWHL